MVESSSQIKQCAKPYCRIYENLNSDIDTSSVVSQEMTQVRELLTRCLESSNRHDMNCITIMQMSLHSRQQPSRRAVFGKSDGCSWVLNPLGCSYSKEVWPMKVKREVWRRGQPPEKEINGLGAQQVDFHVPYKSTSNKTDRYKTLMRRGFMKSMYAL